MCYNDTHVSEMHTYFTFDICPLTRQHFGSKVLFLLFCWERAVPLAFHFCCFYFSAALIVDVPFPFGVEGRMWNSIVSVPDDSHFINFLIN